MTDLPSAPATPDDAPVLLPAEIAPPAIEANSLGGGIDAADLPPSIPDERDRGSAHAASGWRGIDIGKP